MRFGDPGYLWLLLAVAAVGIFFMWAFKAKQKALEAFADRVVLEHLVKSVDFRARKIRAALFLSALFFLAVALGQPQWGYQWKDVKRKGLDIVVALDLSKSMMAEDIKPTRLEGAKREIKSLINIMKGDRIALVAFAGSAFLECPLTLDYGTAKLFLDNLDVNTIPLGGTNLGEAIKAGTEAFEGHEKKHRVLILITDGEDHGDTVMHEVEEAKNRGVVIFTIGIGKQEGAPIPVFDEDGRKGFIKDKDGNIVLSKLDPVLLQKIALMTGGKKGTIGTGSFPLEEIYKDELSKMEKKELESSRQKRYESRFQWPLFVSILLYVIEAVIGERKRVKP
ncbi:MAG: VWA domain-containing protein [Candidatus Omnitrophica bacterium]|nr:VWA domain-containing protein [Candidatus Omnitrophota bacterium]